MQEDGETHEARVMHLLEDLFPASAAIDAAATAVESRMDWKNVPAKAAVYLLTGPDAETGVADHPMLLATVGNLRAALQRRLADDPPELKTRRIAYAKVCTRVYWRTVYSPFAANFYYLHAAQQLFPATYRGMIAWQPAWWIALERGAEFPEFSRTQALSGGDMRYAGPIRDKHAAGRLIENVVDLFDLCRYHNVLVQAPRGKACAYKEMGKCPAPCDGSAPMSWYLDQIDRAFRFITGELRESLLGEMELAMKAAAANLQFEQAARIKQRLTRAAFIGTDPFVHLRSLESFAFLALQPGQGRPFVEPWVIHAAQDPAIRPLPQIKRKELAGAAEALFSQCQRLRALRISPPLSPVTTQQLSLVAHHLFRGSADPGIYLPLDEIDSPDAIVAAATTIFTRKAVAKPVQEHSSDIVAAPVEGEIASAGSSGGPATTEAARKPSTD